MDYAKVCILSASLSLLILIIVLVFNVTHHSQKCCGERWSRNRCILQQLKFYSRFRHQIRQIEYKWTEEHTEMATRSRHDFRNTEELKSQVNKEANLLSLTTQWVSSSVHVHASTRFHFLRQWKTQCSIDKMI